MGLLWLMVSICILSLCWMWIFRMGSLLIFSRLFISSLRRLRRILFSFCRVLFWFVSLLFGWLWFSCIVIRFIIIRFRGIWSLIWLWFLFRSLSFIILRTFIGRWILCWISFRRIFIILFCVRVLVCWGLTWSWTCFHFRFCSFLSFFRNFLFFSSFFNQVLFGCCNFLFSNTISTVPIRTFRAF